MNDTKNKFFFSEKESTETNAMKELFNSICSLRDQYKKGYPYLDDVISKIENNFSQLDYFLFS